MTTRFNVLPDIFPEDLKPMENTLVQIFDNKQDFITRLDKSESNEYAKKIGLFLKKLREGVSLDKDKVETIKNEVRNNLIKRGIVTGSIYEGYKYATEGLIVDYAQLAAGNPECMMTPVKKYDKWFYELYLNMSIPYRVSSSEIEDAAIRVIETIKLLEERNIEIKINVVLFSEGMFTNNDNYLFVLPICSHLEFKDENLLLPFLDEDFLRGPLFSTMYSNDSHCEVSGSLGSAVKLKNSVNLWELNETELAMRVLNDLDLPTEL